MSNGGIDLHGLAGFFLLFLRFHVLERSHVMEPVRQLDDDDTDILRHGQEHLPQILGLQLHLIHGPGQLSQLRDAVDKKRHLFPKLFSQLIQGHNRVFHHIVKDSCRDRLLIHL